MLLRSYGPQRFERQTLDIFLRPSKSIGQTRLDVLRDVIVQTFLRHMTCSARSIGWNQN